ncbi:MAG: ribosome maturation factor RimM [Methylovirgula sp.]
MPKDGILVGQFGAAHGVKGELRLKSYTQDPAAIGSYGKLSDASGARSFEIEALRPLKDDLFVAKLAGVATREAAEKLTNVALFLPREALPAAQEDEFYHADLIGLTAKTEAGEEIGEIVRVLNFGGGDMLEIAPKSGGETLLLPFTKAAVPIVDLAHGHVVVVPPVEVEAASGETRPSDAPQDEEVEAAVSQPKASLASR